MEISNITGIVTFAHAVPYHLAEFMGTKEQVASNRKKIYGISVFMFVVVTVFLQILLNLSLKYSALFLVAAFVIVKFMENVIYDSFFKFGFACSETHTPQMITFWYCVQAVNIVCDVLPYIRPRHWLHPVAGVTLSTVLTLRYISGFVIVSMFCWIMWRYYHNPKLVGEQNWGRVAIFLTYQAITTYSWQVNLSSRLVMAVVIVIYYIKVFHMIIRDTYMEYVHNVDYSKCLGNAQGCQSVYTGMAYEIICQMQMYGYM